MIMYSTHIKPIKIAGPTPNSVNTIPERPAPVTNAPANCTLYPLFS